ncbi:hypothetical protein E2C01_009880 [Portunus trituberculatus]|uniref:Uncharacterized protein n=1 Tax=Portunus trituberculatus TaxID=210409 RepID=A0A5B7D6Y2_PORTR|nr:hypothetical protein [Portunus trituberculatus]
MGRGMEAGEVREERRKGELLEEELKEGVIKKRGDVRRKREREGADKERSTGDKHISGRVRRVKECQNFTCKHRGTQLWHLNDLCFPPPSSPYSPPPPSPPPLSSDGWAAVGSRIHRKIRCWSVPLYVSDPPIPLRPFHPSPPSLSLSVFPTTPIPPTPSADPFG